MKAVEVNNLTFSYEDSSFALKDISFCVEQGEIFLIIGESGCGKTTLLRHLKPAYLPEGKRSGESRIEFHGVPMEKLSEEEQAFLVGYVGQNVESNQVTDKVWHELAFGLESLGYPQDYMQRRVAEVTAFFGLESIYHERLSDISGGQKQIVSLASIMVMEPKILVLDEPTSRLDPLAASDFFRMIRKIHDEIGTTIIMTEHRLEDVMSLASKVMVLDNGSNILFGTPGQVSRSLYERRLPIFRSLPVAARLYYAAEYGRDIESVCDRGNSLYNEKGEQYGVSLTVNEGEAGNKVPLTINEGRVWLQSYMQKAAISGDRQMLAAAGHDAMSGDIRKSGIMSAREVWFRYSPKGRDILSACTIELPKGTITAILGGNGAGKSTLLNVLYRNITPYIGKVSDKGKSTGMLPQNPQAMFAQKRVGDELSASGRQRLENNKDRENDVIEFFGLSKLLDRHPFDLSGGQMEKLGLAKLVLEDQDILLLDEPGKGMDYAFKEKLGLYLRELANAGKTILLVSHDIEFCASYADRCGLFFDGHIVSMSEARDFFCNNVFYTTAVRRLCAGLMDAVTYHDALECLGLSDDIDDYPGGNPDGVNSDGGNPEGECDKAASSGCGGKEDVDSADIGYEAANSGYEDGSCKVSGEESHRKKIGSKLYGLIFLVVMPLTIYLGHTVLHQRKYYFISLAIILEGIGAFFVSYEKGRRGLKEIMTIAVMSAITALSRAAFYMIPAVKPMAALTIISGVALGEVDGFLVGALSMLVSDIFFGQGPWTPWQMFTMGLVGFLAGAVFSKKNIYILRKGLENDNFKRNSDMERNVILNQSELALLSTFGLLAVFIIYGGIMNPASVLMYQENVSWKMLFASYVPGIPIDIIHAVSTFIFLWIGAEPMLEKLERVRKK